LISAAHLTRCFGDRVAVDDLSLEIKDGEIFALLGPNGAGKTTTLRMLAGLIAPTSGTARVDGIALTPRAGAGSPDIRQRVGFLTESPGLWDRLSARINLLVYARLYGTPDPDGTVRRALDLFDLADRAESMAGELSKGLRQRLALARALIHDPRVILLDEPTAGLDPATSRRVRELVLSLRSAGRTIVLCTHNLDEAERVADRIGVLQHRLVAMDTANALRRKLFNLRVRIRVADQAERFAALVGDGGASSVAIDGDALLIQVQRPDEEIPVLVRTLVLAGAAVREVATEEPPLETVYLKLLGER
jgi:ABC-2 type transport system ATP-binding protein